MRLVELIEDNSFGEPNGYMLLVNGRYNLNLCFISKNDIICDLESLINASRCMIQEIKVRIPICTECGSEKNETN